MSKCPFCGDNSYSLVFKDGVMWMMAVEQAYYDSRESDADFFFYWYQDLRGM